MKKFLEIAGALIAVFLLFLGLASAALHFFLPPEKAKALVLKQLTAHLKREVRMGSVSVGVLSGLDVGNLEVSESPDFSHGLFISSERFTIRLALLPLLFRKVVVKHLVLCHPVIHVVRYKDGKTFNFSDLLSPGAPSGHPSHSPAPQGAREPPFYFIVTNAQIQHGNIRFEDHSPARQSVDIDPLELKLRNVSLISPFHLQVSLKAKAKGIEAVLQLAGEADLRTASFKIKNCALSSGGSTVRLAGQASRLISNRPKVDLRLTVDEFKLATLASFVPLPAGFSLAGPIIAQARVKGDQQQMEFSAKADLAKVKMGIEDEFSKPANVPMGVSLQGQLKDLKDVEIQGLKAVLGSLQVTGHGRVEGATSQQPQVDLHLESNSFPVRELADYVPLQLPKELGLKGSALLSVDVSGTQISSRITAKGEGKDLAVSWGDKFAKPAGMPMRASMEGEMLRTPHRSTFNIQRLDANLGPIALSGKGSLETAARTARFQLTLAGNRWPLKELAAMAPLLAPYHVSGTVTVNVRASGAPSAPAASGTVGLQDVSAHYQQSELSQVSATLGFTQQDVSISHLTGKLNGADLSLKLTGHRLTTEPAVTVEANVGLLDLDKLLPPLTSLRTDPALAFALVPSAWAAAAALPPMKLSGHLTVGRVKQEFYDARNLDLRWNLTDVTPDLSQLSGTAVLKQGPGKLSNVDKLVLLSRTARIALLPITTLQKIDQTGLLKNLGLPSLQAIPFDEIHGDYLFQSGVMTVKAFDLTGRSLNVSTLGTIGLAGEQPLNLRVTMKLAPGSVGGTVGELVTDESGRPTLAFTAKGTAANPTVRLDVREAGQKAIQKVGEQLLKGLGWGGNASSAPPSNEAGSSQTPENPPQNPVEDIQKTLKNIFH